MENFEKLLTKLYTNDHQTITSKRKATLLEELVQIAERSSTIGKLFWTIPLNRILSIKSKICPDPTNQLGFLKGAHTFDRNLHLKQ